MNYWVLIIDGEFKLIHQVLIYIFKHSANKTLDAVKNTVSVDADQLMSELRVK